MHVENFSSHVSFELPLCFSPISGSNDVPNHVYVVPRLSCELYNFERGFGTLFELYQLSHK